MASSVERIGVVQESVLEGNVRIGSSSSESTSSRVPLPSSSGAILEASSPAAPSVSVARTAVVGRSIRSSLQNNLESACSAMMTTAAVEMVVVYKYPGDPACHMLYSSGAKGIASHLRSNFSKNVRLFSEDNSPPSNCSISIVSISKFLSSVTKEECDVIFKECFIGSKESNKCNPFHLPHGWNAVYVGNSSKDPAIFLPTWFTSALNVDNVEDLFGTKPKPKLLKAWNMREKSVSGTSAFVSSSSVC